MAYSSIAEKVQVMFMRTVLRRQHASHTGTHRLWCPSAPVWSEAAGPPCFSTNPFREFQLKN